MQLNSPRYQRVIIRADGSQKRGLGHITRTITLAEVLKRSGLDVQFVTRNYPQGGHELVADAGFEIATLDSGASYSQDLEFTAYVCREASVIITDGYFVDEHYQRTLMDETTAVLVCIDDIAHVPYVSDLLVNASPHARAENYDVSADTEMLLGTAYALLRNEFLSARPEFPWIAPEVKRVLVTMGGSDPPDFTGKLATWLKSMGLSVDVTFLTGHAYHGGEALRSTVELWKRADIATDVKNVVPLFVAADLVISAAGTTCWELAFLGKPIVTVAIADNQQPIAEELSQRGAAINLGSHEEVGETDFSDAILSLLRSREKREQLAKAVFQLVDGEGKYRIVSKIQELTRKRSRV